MCSARDSPWSSYCATADQQEPLPFLATDWILSQFSDDHRRVTDLYRKFVKQGRGVVGVWDELRGRVLMGSDAFVEGIAPLLWDSVLQREIPQRERLVSRPSLGELFAEWETKAVRNERIYEITRIHEYTVSELQEYVGLHYSTISRIASRVEAEQRSKDKI